jgi:quercetin dioxygenase-like cupin family protein
MSGGAATQRRGFVLGPGEGDAVWSLGGHFTTKARATDTDHHLALVETLAWRSTEPPLHIHHREHEAWYVLEGQMTLQVGGDRLMATAGCFAFAPKGIPHAFTVDVEPTRVLVMATPAGFEQFANDLGIPATGTVPAGTLEVPPPEVLGPIAERYGIEVVGPPLRVALAQDADR